MSRARSHGTRVRVLGGPWPRISLPTGVSEHSGGCTSWVGPEPTGCLGDQACAGSWGLGKGLAPPGGPWKTMAGRALKPGRWHLDMPQAKPLLTGGQVLRGQEEPGWAQPHRAGETELAKPEVSGTLIQMTEHEQQSVPNVTAFPFLPFPPLPSPPFLLILLLFQQNFHGM